MGLEIKQLTRLQIIRYCEKLEEENKKLEEENKKMKDIINKIVYLYKEEPTAELEEYVKSGFKGGMSN